MMCEIGRYLNQSINHVSDWTDDDFLLTHAEINPILEAEQPGKER